MRLNFSELCSQPKLAHRVSAAVAHNAAQRPAVLRPEYWASEADLHRAITGMIGVEAHDGVICFHPANGGTRGKAEAGRLKGMGVLPGVPDLIIIDDWKAYGLEIKMPTGRMSPAQIAMQHRFKVANTPYAVVRSVYEARIILKRWQIIPHAIR